MSSAAQSENQIACSDPESVSSTRRGVFTLAAAGCSLAAATAAGAAAAPAAARPLGLFPPFAQSSGQAIVPSPQLLGSGDRGPAVKQLQRALGIAVTGVFSDATEKAVVKFQHSRRLTADGVVGPQTRKALHLRVRIIDPASTANTAWSPSVGASSATGGYSIPTGIVMCESGGNYSAVNPATGAGGAYQILPSTWAAYGGTGLPQNASPAEQNAVAGRIYASAGPGQWSC
jgi:peptidoglycan hydrolase-like protein with peptidoglycan-binding domain